MTRGSMTRRPGTSLLEVLVGLGIMAVGAISAFVLFPFAALNVSRALTDDRTTTCAITADGQLREIHRTRVVAPVSAGSVAAEDYHTRMDDPLTGAAAVPQDSTQPSNPVFVDPMGYEAGLRVVGRGGTAPATVNPTLITRTNLAVVSGAIDPKKMAQRFCSQLDGLLFDEGGAVPTGANANANDMRELRYNWLWVLQRPVNRDRLTVRQQVVVFNKRVHLYVPPESEAVHRARFVPGASSITNVPTTAEVSKGTWLMDGTIGTDDGGRSIRHAEWYRVTSVTEDTTTTPPSLALEIHKPITRPDGLRPTDAGTSYTGVIVVFPAVVEVFERPALTGIGAP